MKDLSNSTVIQKQKNGISYLQFRRLLEYPEIRHMYVLKNGNLNFKRMQDTEEATEQLRQTYQRVCKLEEMDADKLVRPSQSHTDTIQVVTEEIVRNGPAMYLPELENTDGVMTQEKNIVLSTTNADCLLLLFYDPQKKVIANVHSGWKGTFQKIAQKAVEKMQRMYESNPADILCFMSPCIEKCCFEIHEDVKKLCEEIFPNAAQFITDIGEIEGKRTYKMDHVAINHFLVKQAGLKEENIVESHICSVCEQEQIHSRRAEGPEYGVGTLLICRK